MSETESTPSPEVTTSAPPAEAPAPVERPEWLPEKFSSVEDAAKAYLELEQKLSSQEAEPQPEVQAEPAVEQPPESTTLDFTEFTQEFDATGTLSEESLEKLQSFGLPREFVESYMEGHKALAQRQTESIWQLAGGQENYDQMVQWASRTLDEASIQAFNNALDQSPQHAELAVRGLMAQFRTSGAYQPQLIDGAPEALRGSYRSADEWHQDMRSPRYRSDESFRKQVAEKLARSNIN